MVECINVVETLYHRVKGNTIWDICLIESAMIQEMFKERNKYEREGEKNCSRSYHWRNQGKVPWRRDQDLS